MPQCMCYHRYTIYDAIWCYLPSDTYGSVISVLLIFYIIYNSLQLVVETNVYSRKDNLKSHLKRDHGIVDVKQGRFVCHFPECNMKFCHARKLAVHYSKEHI